MISVVHAVSGCDTTSRVFGTGKSAVLKKLKNEFFARQASVFSDSRVTPDEIVAAGEKLLVALLNGKEIEELNIL